MKVNKGETAIFTAYDDFAPHDPAEPERNLLKAILETAMNDLHKDGRKSKEAFRFFLNPDEEYLFSFESICSYLNIPSKQILMFTGLTEDPEFMVSYRRLREARDAA